MRRPHPLRPTRRRRRPLAGLLGLAAVTTGLAFAPPADAADFHGRIFTIEGTFEMWDMNDDVHCIKGFSATTQLRNVDREIDPQREKSFTFKKKCGDVTAELFMVATLQKNNNIETSGWVRVKDGSEEIAWRAHAAGYSPDWVQVGGPALFGDPSRGLVVFSWTMRNTKAWS